MEPARRLSLRLGRVLGLGGLLLVFGLLAGLAAVDGGRSGSTFEEDGRAGALGATPAGPGLNDRLFAPQGAGGASEHQASLALTGPGWPEDLVFPDTMPAVAAAPIEPAPPEARPASKSVVLSPPPAIGGQAFAVVERSCGAVIWGQNETEQLAPASVTKIVTALVVMERASLDEEAVSNVSGARMKERGSSVMGVEPGMRLSVLDLLNGLMLKSGNDAALVLAEHAGAGSVEAFVEAMNLKAQELGMNNTHFSNPHGLDEDGHYSSALDMATAGDAMLEDPVLAEISVTDEYWPHWDGPSLKNGNKLLQRYPGAYGVKIGYTKDAGQTLVAAAERDGRHIIVSVFGSEDRYSDATLLFDWAFANTTPAC